MLSGFYIREMRVLQTSEWLLCHTGDVFASYAIIFQLQQEKVEKVL